MDPKLLFLSSPEVWQVGHGSDHPLKPERLQRTHELLGELGAFEMPSFTLRSPRVASDEELALFHTSEYISAVHELSEGGATFSPTRFNFGPGDNPVFRGMHESEGRKVGSALMAAEALLAGECTIAFSYSGGLHHGGPDFASGFCVYNDAAVAIERLIQQGRRVAYVDVDVHHGDGVQNAFYESDRVLTISLHQDPRTLFPGTGRVEEIGRGTGEGSAINLPLPPGTDDDLYFEAFRRIVPAAIERFGPDLLVTQLGVDTHYLDPLAQMALTTEGQQSVFAELSALGMPWLALGGGGYNLDTVPRSWTLAVGIMLDHLWPRELPASYRQQYGGRYLRDLDRGLTPPAATAEIVAAVEETLREVERIHGL